MSEQLADKQNCIGCGICSLVCPKECITMADDALGFREPVIDQQACIHCGRCTAYCVQIKQFAAQNQLSRSFYGWVNNEAERVQSTSGGIGSALSRAMLKQGGFVVGAKLDEQHRLHHAIANTLEEANAFRGSKYLQSDILPVVGEIGALLKSGRKGLFVGTPCQVAALKHYMEKEKIGTDNLVLCELLCHGVPSPGVFHKYCQWLEKKNRSNIVDYVFRSKANGWNQMASCVTFADGKKNIEKAEKNAYHMWFGLHLSIRGSCFDCRYRQKHRNGDIVIGDFWEAKERGFSASVPIEKGISKVYVVTSKGKALLDLCDSITLHETNLEQTIRTTAYLLNNPAVPPNRQSFITDYQQSRIGKMVRTYRMKPRWVRAIKARLRSVFKSKKGECE